MHTISHDHEGLIRRHAHRLVPRADRVAELFVRGLGLSGLGRSTRRRLGVLVTADPARALTALCEWPAGVLCDRITAAAVRSPMDRPLTIRELGLARLALISAVGCASRGDWSDELERAWCWRVDTVCDLLAPPVGRAHLRAA